MAPIMDFFPPAAGNGAILGGAYKNSKKLHTISRAKQHDRTGGPVVCSLFTKNLRRVDFQEFLKNCSEIAYS